MIYSTGSHTKFYHRFHVVWTTKYRYKVMRGEMRERIREIIIQTCQELGVHIEKGVLSTDHVHMFISVPPQIALSKVMMRIKGRSSYKIQREFPESRKRYWGQRFWARGFFSTTSGNVTDAVILQYLELHAKRKPTGVSRYSFRPLQLRYVAVVSVAIMAGRFTSHAKNSAIELHGAPETRYRPRRHN